MWNKYEVRSLVSNILIESGLEYKFRKNNIRVYASYDLNKNFFITKHSYDLDGKEVLHFKLILNRKSIEQINKTIDFINQQEDLQIPYLENGLEIISTD